MFVNKIKYWSNMSARNQNTLIVALGLVIIAFLIVMFGPLIVDNNFDIGPEYRPVIIFSGGFMLIIFAFIFLAIKQRRNIYG